MKVIDLLNMIANGEKIPKKIKYAGYEFFKSNDCRYYTFFDEENYQANHLMEYLRCGDMNDEIKILEDAEEIDIQSIEELPKIIYISLNESDIRTEFNNIIDNQNTILNAIKQLDNKLKEK